MSERIDSKKEGEAMANRVDKIRRKLESRRREIQGRSRQKERSAPMVFQRHDEARDEPDFYLYTDNKKGTEQEKWLEKDRFMLRSMISVVLFLVIAIMYKTGMPQLEGARQVVHDTFQHEFEFAVVEEWYQNQFGRPLALLPMQSEVALEDVDNQNPQLVYAVPASGSITQSFEQNGTGILVETEAEAPVESVKAGYVFYIGEQDNLGRMVGIQHSDGSESWYGMLQEVNVKLYDTVEAGKILGKVTSSNEAGKGIYYFALKQGEVYIDPIEVIQFD